MHIFKSYIACKYENTFKKKVDYKTKQKKAIFKAISFMLLNSFIDLGETSQNSPK